MMGFKLLKGIYGQTIKTCEVGGFTLAETLYEPGLKIRRHSHQHAHFCLLLYGAFREVCDNKTLECKPLSVSFLAAGEMHADHFHKTVSRCFIIDVEPQWMERAREHSLLLYGAANFQGGSPTHLALKLNKEFHLMDQASPLAIEGLALEIMAEASRRQVRDADRRIPRWLEQAREILHTQFSELPTHAEIAGMVGVHPVHLAREFRRHYRRTIGEYTRQLQIEHACLRLSTSDASLNEVALDAGFFDQSHFARTFKRHMGLTPAVYRAASLSR